MFDLTAVKGIDGNEKWGGSQKDDNGWVLVWDFGNRWLFAIKHAFLCKKNSFRFRLIATAELIGDYLYNR